MKFAKHPLTLAALIGSTILSGHAWAADPFPTGPYVSLGAGVSQPEVSRPTIIGPPAAAGLPNTSTPSKFSFDLGYNVLMSGGYKMDNGLRPEIELGFRSSDIKNVNSMPFEGKERTLSFMANLLYDINTDSMITPYLGGGIGVGHMQFKNVTGAGPGSAPNAVYSGHDTNFQWQAIGGVTVPLASQLAMFVEYRYIRLNNNDISSRSNSVSQVVNHDDGSHNFLIGFRYSFGHNEPVQQAAAAAPPPPPPPPPPQAAPPPVPEKVLAFFDFDKSNLRPDAKDIVRQAADYAKTNNKTVIRVTGHTDTSGSAQYNMALSKRRAMAVKAELIRLGIPANEINVAWKGKSEPLVQTGDGVKEPQNRRVEIIYD